MVLAARGQREEEGEGRFRMEAAENGAVEVVFVEAAGKGAVLPQRGLGEKAIRGPPH